MSRTTATVCLVCACACGPRVVIDAESGEDEDETTSGSPNETASSDGGSSITLPATSTATTPTPTTDESGGSSTGVEPPCADVETESLVCMFVDAGTVQLVGMDTGRLCEYAQLDTKLFPNSLVWSGDELLVCNGDQSSFRADLVGGTVTGIANICQAASPYASGILVKQGYPDDPMLLYGSIDEFVAEEFTTVELFPYASQIAVEGDVLYAAWHSTEHLEVWDIAAEARLDDLWLDGYDDRVNGLAVVDDVVLVLGESGGNAILGFDAGSGENLLDVGLPDTFAPGGLVCR